MSRMTPLHSPVKMIVDSKIRGESINRTVRQRFLAGLDRICRQDSADKTTYSEVNSRGGVRQGTEIMDKGCAESGILSVIAILRQLAQR